jgi:ADP-ribose pyrophosphatase
MKVLPWEELGREIRYTTRIFRVRKDRMRSPAGIRERDYDVIEAPDWTNVIAITDEDNVVLIRQYRPGVKSITLEIPGGMIDPGETPLQAAMRELSEETGYQSSGWRHLGTIFPNPAIQTNRAITFLAQSARRLSEPHPDEDECIEVFERPLKDVSRLIRDGEIQHSLVVVAFAHLAVNGLIDLNKV